MKRPRKADRLPKITTSDARFRAGLDAVVIRASTNLGRLIDWQFLVCQEITPASEKCRRPATAIIYSRIDLKEYRMCDLCASAMIRKAGIVLLAQAPMSKEISS